MVYSSVHENNVTTTWLLLPHLRRRCLLSIAIFSRSKQYSSPTNGSFLISISRRTTMETTTERVIWMPEELDFAPLSIKERSQLEQLVNQFLDAAAASGLRHCLYPAS